MKNPFQGITDGIAKLNLSLKRMGKLTEVIEPLSNYYPMFALLRAFLEEKMTKDEFFLHLQQQHPIIRLTAYDLVVLYNFIHDSLVANDLLDKKSRAEFVYFSREAGDIFYGHLDTVPTLTVYVINEEHYTVVWNAVEDRLAKMRRRNKSPFPIPTIEVVKLKDHQRPYKKWKADIFGNIPFIVDKVNLDPSVKNV